MRIHTSLSYQPSRNSLFQNQIKYIYIKKVEYSVFLLKETLKIGRKSIFLHVHFYYKIMSTGILRDTDFQYHV